MHNFSGLKRLRSLRATVVSIHYQSAASALAPSSGAHIHVHTIAPRSDPGRPAGLMIAALSRLITHGLSGPCIISVLSGPCGSTPRRRQPADRGGGNRVGPAPLPNLRVRPMNHETPKTPRRRRVRVPRRRRRRTRRLRRIHGDSAASEGEAWSKPAHQCMKTDPAGRRAGTGRSGRLGRLGWELEEGAQRALPAAPGAERQESRDEAKKGEGRAGRRGRTAMEVGSGKMGVGGGANGCFVCHVSPLYACSSRNLAPLQCVAQANNPF